MSKKDVRAASPERAVVGAVIRERRKAIGLSEEALALATDVDRTYLSDIELGYSSPSLKVFFRLCDGLGVTPGWLLHVIERRARSFRLRATTPP